MTDQVHLILGTMTFGPQVDLESSKSMVRRFLDAGNCEIDTAYVYNDGNSEKYLGAALANEPLTRARIATKVNPRITGRLDAEAIFTQVNESLARLQRDSVDTIYLHFPDPATPIENTLEACATLHAQGKFSSLGLSNFPAWEVVNIWHHCKQRGWPQPEVYQGLYNGLSRNVESELLPALRCLGMRFYAYNPLAGGILTGKHSEYDEDPSPGRFTFRPNYKDRYWKRSFFEALSVLTRACGDASIAVAQAAYRWLGYHSSLDGTCGDGIIIGASNPNQLEQNLVALDDGPLPKTVIEAFDLAWNEAKTDSPSYFRYTG